ncbi:hypothetical protein TrCOL_g6668 [Triparma columacea]|uniref:Uncharacterized protein n=1 Tax=Triparma columacea TaxID=722753 RepID=A0A9W7GQN9_9STRA|nr:hypothetical protein TrCOL_g6668 [Triparma columacea]
MQDETSLRWEDLSIDDSLAALPRLIQYTQSPIALQRLVHVKQLSDVCLKTDLQTLIGKVLPIIRKLEEDEEYVVRQHLVEQVVKVGVGVMIKDVVASDPPAKLPPPPSPMTDEYVMEILEGDEVSKLELYKTTPYRTLILETFLPMLARMLSDQSPEVRTVCSSGLVSLSKCMNAGDLGPHVLTVVLQLAHDDENEEMRMTAAGLLADMCAVIGADLVRQFVAPEIISLAEDPVFRVRKASALNLAKICKIAGPADTKNRLLPAYVRLTRDDMYRVRKACAESLVEMSKVVDSATRRGELVSVFAGLLDDSSKFVRNAALQHLGNFISTLADDEDPVPSLLIEKFIGMAQIDTGDATTDAELRLHCAFSFPAVVLAVESGDRAGKGGWLALVDAFQILVRDVMWNVRKTLSCSLHEIAKLLEPQLVERDLLQVFELFLRDSEEVKVGVISHIYEFLSVLSPLCRESYLHTLTEIFDSGSPLNWRMRHIVAKQLPKLINLFEMKSVQHSILPLVVTLLRDPVAEVRTSSFAAVASMFELKGGNQGKVQVEIIREMTALAVSTTYVDRVSFLCTCQILAAGQAPTELVEEDKEKKKERILELCTMMQNKKLFGLALKLKDDKTSNVRVACWKLFTSLPEEFIAKHKELKKGLQELEDDKVVMKTVNKVILYPTVEEDDAEKEAGEVEAVEPSQGEEAREGQDGQDINTAVTAEEAADIPTNSIESSSE